MKKLIFILPLFLFAEIDPFGAGVKGGYGLTEDEKLILKNQNDIKTLKKDLKNIKIKMFEYEQKLQDINDKTGGLNTLINDISTLKEDLKKDEANLTQLNEKVKNLEEEVNKIKESLKEINRVQKDNFLYLRGLIEEILVKLKNLNKPLSPKEAMQKAKKAFFANRLDEAQKYFEYTLSKRYLPATSAYYLGEIAYKKGDYEKALAYYKKSIEIYPKKAKFTARLLYHTAISFKKLGNVDAAKMTLKKIIQDFPKTKYATLAKKELQKLQ